MGPGDLQKSWRDAHEPLDVRVANIEPNSAIHRVPLQDTFQIPSSGPTRGMGPADLTDSRNQLRAMGSEELKTCPPVVPIIFACCEEHGQVLGLLRESHAA